MAGRDPLRSSSLRVLSLTAWLLASCGPSSGPTTAPTVTEPTTDGVWLRYAAADPLRHELTMELTHTSVGLYLEAKVGAEAQLTTAADGDELRSSWALEGLSALELVGTVEEDEPDAVRRVLDELGPVASTCDPHGTPAATPTDALTTAASEGGLSPAATLVVSALGDATVLPRLPDAPLPIGEPVEHEEESETVLTDADQVLPTTTVRRYTLRGMDDTGVAELAIELASVAEPAVDPDAPDDEPPALRVEIRAEGTLLFDVERGVPVRYELSRTEQFAIGDDEVERSLLVRSQWSAP